MSTWIRLLLVIVLVSGAARAQDEDGFERIELRLVAAGGESYYLDGGREKGLEIGDRVQIFPLGGARLDGMLRAVARSSARLELDSKSSMSIEIGTRVEVLVPRARLEQRAREAEAARARAASSERQSAPAGAQEPVAPAQQPPTAQGPEHPPWTHPPVEWQQGVPLLAPIAGIEPEDRPRDWRGSWRVGGDWIEDRAGEDRTTLALRSGLDLEVDNPFGQGGRMQLDAELYGRSVSVQGEPDEEETRVRFDRFSYAWGGVRGEPRRWEIGRFLSSEFPELGVIDGVEMVQRFESGSRAGASAGFLPEWTDAMESGDDAQGALFYRWVDSPDERLALGAAAQKTWHQGQSDRDLVVLTGDWRPSTRAFFHTGAWVDWYGSEDEVHDPGPELTRFIANANFLLGERSGVGLFLTHFRFPEMTSDLDPALAAELADERTTRLSLSGWHDLTSKLRMYARADRWQDEEDSGGGGELRVSARDLAWDEGDLSLGVFRADGSFSSGTGVRLSASRRFGRHSLRLDLETTGYDQEGVLGEQATLQHDAVRALWDVSFDDLDLSLWAEERFGDEQNSTALGFVLQRGF